MNKNGYGKSYMGLIQTGQYDMFPDSDYYPLLLGIGAGT